AGIRLCRAQRSPRPSYERGGAPSYRLRCLSENDQVHEQAVVPAAVRVALVGAQDADRLEAAGAEAAHRALVGGIGIDREAVVAFGLEVLDHQSQHPAPVAAAME